MTTRFSKTRGKIYWRDCGLLDAFAGLHNLEQVLGHPLYGPSWEAFAWSKSCLPPGTQGSQDRVHAGAEIDLVLESADGEVIAVVVKPLVRSFSSKS